MDRRKLKILTRSHWEDKFKHTSDCKEVVGVVESSEVFYADSGSEMLLKIEGHKKEFKLKSCDRQGALPRIDVGEVVVLHFDDYSGSFEDYTYANGIQVLRGESVIFRAVFRHNTGYYQTETIKRWYGF